MNVYFIYQIACKISLLLFYSFTIFVYMDLYNILKQQLVHKDVYANMIFKMIISIFCLIIYNILIIFRFQILYS